MDLAQILKQLWYLRLPVALGILVSVVAGIATTSKITWPLGFESRSIEFGAASTEVLVDSPRSPLFDIAGDIGPLSERAAIYTRLVESTPVKQAIGREAGVSPDLIVVTTRSPTPTTRSGAESPAEQRANELMQQNVAHRLLFTVEEDLPVITIDAQAPSGEAAVRLANAAATGLAKYVTRLEVSQDVPERRAIEVRQLGAAIGGTVNEGANRILGFVTGTVVFVIWCLLLLVAAGVIRGWREDSSSAAEEDGSPAMLDLIDDRVRQPHPEPRLVGGGEDRHAIERDEGPVAASARE